MRSFDKRCDDFKRGVIDTITFFEEKHAIFIRRVRLVCERHRFKISVDVIKNRWLFDEKARAEEKELVEQFKRWITSSFAWLWVHARIDKFYFEVDIKNGGVNFVMQDWGIGAVPSGNLVFREVIEKAGRTSLEETKQGHLYENPDLWNDREVDGVGVEPIKDLMVEIYVPPAEEP